MKTITSPVKRFPGTVTLPDYLNVPQATAWEKAQAAAEAIDREASTNAEYIAAWVGGITAVVQVWNLDGFTADPFQTTPRLAVIELMAWLIREITRLYVDDDDPNA